MEWRVSFTKVPGTSFIASFEPVPASVHVGVDPLFVRAPSGLRIVLPTDDTLEWFHESWHSCPADVFGPLDACNLKGAVVVTTDLAVPHPVPMTGTSFDIVMACMKTKISKCDTCHGFKWTIQGKSSAVLKIFGLLELHSH